MVFSGASPSVAGGVTAGSATTGEAATGSGASVGLGAFGIGRPVVFCAQPVVSAKTLRQAAKMNFMREAFAGDPARAERSDRRAQRSGSEDRKTTVFSTRSAV